MPVARKANPATAPRTVEAEPDLLSSLSDDTAVANPEAVVDLLDGLSEDNGMPWVPDDDDDPSPAGIQGTVTYRGTVHSDYGPEECPLIELTAADGFVWSIRGYATVLRNQINKADPAIGDLMACKFFGLKPSKNGKDYKNFKVVVQHK